MIFLPPYVWTDLVFALVFVIFIAHVLGARKKIPEMKGRLDLFDFAKGIAIIAVVLVHTGTVVVQGRMLDPYLGFGVELFILCSGYLLARRYAAKFETEEYLKKMKGEN